jgi:hypothetical protein
VSSATELGAADRDRLVDEARAAVKELTTQVRDLQEAMKLFGTDFAREDFVRAFDRRREDAKEAARVNQLNWPLSTLVNQLNTVLANGAVLDGLRRLDQPEKAPEVYEALRGADIIDRDRVTQLTRLNRTRNSLTHRYGLLAEGGDVYDATLLAVTVVKSFGDDFGGWLRKTGVLPKAKSD